MSSTGSFSASLPTTSSNLTRLVLKDIPTSPGIMPTPTNLSQMSQTQQNDMVVQDILQFRIVDLASTHSSTTHTTTCNDSDTNNEFDSSSETDPKNQTFTDQIISVAINGKDLTEIDDQYLHLICECIEGNLNIQPSIHSFSFLKQLMLFIIQNKDSKRSSTKLIYVIQLLSAILNIRFNKDVISKEFIITLVQLLDKSNIYLIQRLLRLFCIIAKSKKGKYLLIKYGMMKYLVTMKYLKMPSICHYKGT